MFKIIMAQTKVHEWYVRAKQKLHVHLRPNRKQHLRHIILNKICCKVCLTQMLKLSFCYLIQYKFEIFKFVK